MTKINRVITQSIDINFDYNGSKCVKITEEREASRFGTIKDFFHTYLGFFNSDYNKYFHFDKETIEAKWFITDLLKENELIQKTGEANVKNLPIEDLKDLALRQIKNLKSKKTNTKPIVSPEQIINKIKEMNFYKKLSNTNKSSSSTFEGSTFDYDAKTSLPYLIKYTSTELLPLLDKYNDNEKFIRSLIALGYKLRDFEENSKESPLTINDLTDLDNNYLRFDTTNAIPANFNKDTHAYDFNINGELVSVKIIEPTKGVSS